MINNSTPDIGDKEPASHGRLLSGDQFPILKGMSPVLIGILNNASNLIHVSEDVELLREGDTTRDLYFIAFGAASITKRDGSGVVELCRLGNGDVLGEFAILRGWARFASVRTLKLCHIIRVNGEAVEQVIQVDADFRERLTQLMRKRILSSFLIRHPVFQSLSEAAVSDVAESLNFRFVKKGEQIFEQGSCLDAPCMIISGEATVSVEGAAPVLLEVLRDKDVIGAAIDEKGRSVCSAVATSDTDLLVLDNEALSLFRSHSSHIANQLEQLIAQRAADTFKRIDSVSS